jgi:hypothetical protein
MGDVKDEKSKGSKDNNLDSSHNRNRIYDSFGFGFSHPDGCMWGMRGLVRFGLHSK